MEQLENKKSPAIGGASIFSVDLTIKSSFGIGSLPKGNNFRLLVFKDIRPGFFHRIWRDLSGFLDLDGSSGCLDNGFPDIVMMRFERIRSVTGLGFGTGLFSDIGCLRI